MVTLSPQRRQAVRDCLVSVLQDSLDESLTDLQSQTLQSCFERATAVMSATMDAVGLVFKDFSAQWNAAHPDPLISLPTELIRECLSPLDLPGRIAVSHVSRSWRRAALADCILWDHYALPRHFRGDLAILEDALSVMLSRSRPLPFHFVCNNFDKGLPDALLDIVSRNMDRMATLRIGPEFLRLSHLDAPVLTRLTYDVYRDRALPAPEFPAQWGAFHAPCLQTLNLVCVRLPTNLLPLPALHALTAQVPRNGAFCESFACAFPNLTTLRLVGITQQSLNMPFHLPPSLVAIHLSTGRSEGDIDYSHFLRACEHQGPQELFITNARSISNALELFVQKSTDQRTMELNRTTLYLRDAENNASWEIRSNKRIGLASQPDSLGLLRCFATLTLTLYDFWCLHDLESWDRLLPSLCSLTLTLYDESDHSYARRACRNSLGICMPALESLTLSVRRQTGYVVIKTLSFVASSPLPLMLSNASRPLASIHIHPDDLAHLSRQDVAPFLLLAERVVVGNADAPLVFHAEQDPAADAATN